MSERRPAARGPLRRLRELGLSRVQSFVDGLADGTEALEAFAADLRAAGVTLERPLTAKHRLE